VDNDELELCLPDLKFRDAFLAFLEDYRLSGEQRYQELRPLAETDFAGLVRTRRDMEEGKNLEPNRVPATEYWLVRGGRDVLGVVRLRHYLNASLAHEGGHIGYDLRPGDRGKGYGTRMLALALEKARAKGFKRVMVTCDKDNLPSARVIQKNGGRLTGEVVSHHSGKTVQHYWIQL
jgi:predicted acetyltransferase